MKFHITDNMEIKECFAEKGKCPYKLHFNSQQEVYDYFENEWFISQGEEISEEDDALRRELMDELNKQNKNHSLKDSLINTTAYIYNETEAEIKNNQALMDIIEKCVKDYQEAENVYKESVRSIQKNYQTEMLLNTLKTQKSVQTEQFLNHKYFVSMLFANSGVEEVKQKICEETITNIMSELYT